MPTSCDGQDVQLFVQASRKLMKTTARGPSKPCDPDYCRIESEGKGPKCPPGLCGHSGKFRPKSHCPEELWGRLAVRAERGVPAADPKAIEALRKARKQAVREVLPALRTLAKTLEAVRRKKALASDEEDLLGVVKAWIGRLASEGKPRGR